MAVELALCISCVQRLVRIIIIARGCLEYELKMKSETVEKLEKMKRKQTRRDWNAKG